MKSFDSYRKWKYTKFLSNKNYSFNRNYILNIISSKIITDAFNSISKWKYYKKTPLLKLEKLNKNLKLNNIFYKDESKRFHLKSFKALGGAYAVEKISKGKKILQYHLQQLEIMVDQLLGALKDWVCNVKFLLVNM